MADNENPNPNPGAGGGAPGAGSPPAAAKDDKKLRMTTAEKETKEKTGTVDVVFLIDGVEFDGVMYPKNKRVQVDRALYERAIMPNKGMAADADAWEARQKAEADFAKAQAELDKKKVPANA